MVLQHSSHHSSLTKDSSSLLTTEASSAEAEAMVAKYREHQEHQEHQDFQVMEELAIQMLHLAAEPCCSSAWARPTL